MFLSKLMLMSAIVDTNFSQLCFLQNCTMTEEITMNLHH